MDNGSAINATAKDNVYIIYSSKKLKDGAKKRDIQRKIH